MTMMASDMLRYISIQQRATQAGLTIDVKEAIGKETQFLIYNAHFNEWICTVETLSAVNCFLSGWIRHSEFVARIQLMESHENEQNAKERTTDNSAEITTPER